MTCGAKNPFARIEIAERSVVRSEPEKTFGDGGEPMRTASRTVAANVWASLVGKRCGSAKIANDATPNGMSGSAERTRRAIRFARSSRFRPPPRRASIDRETSKTTYA